MKKIIWIITILVLMLPVYGEEIQLDLDYDVYEVGQTIAIHGENISAESIQIKVTDSTGAGLYNIDQIPVNDGALNYNFIMPENADIGNYEIHTSIGITLTFELKKKAEKNPTAKNILRLNTYNVELEVGSEAEVTSHLLKATSNMSGNVTWLSNDTSVATVDKNGQVTAVAPGKTTITAKLNRVSTIAQVEVFLIGEELTPQGAVSFNLPYISGYPDGTFRPNNTITRAELAVIYSKILGLTEMSQQAFDDVKDSHWAYDYVNKVAAAGIFSGYSDHTFRPDQAITRAELATTISKYWSLKGIEISEEKLLVSDVNNHWAKNYIYKLYHGKVVNSDMTNFDPDGPALRGQVVEMINNLLGRKPLDVETSKFKDLKDASLIKIIEAATTIILNN